MAARHGYKVETHRVTTEDGYVLSMHRIPRGRESNRGGTIPIPKNCDSDSLAHFGGIGTGIVNKGIVNRIVFRFPIPNYTNRWKELRFMIPDFEELCHL